MVKNIVIIILGIAILVSLMINEIFLDRNKDVDSIEVIDELFYQKDNKQFIFCDSLLLNKIFNKNVNGLQKILIFRYFENECFSCIVDDIEFILKWHSVDIEKNKVVLLPNLPRNIQDSILISSTVKGLKYIGIEDTLLNIGNIDKKYFAILDSEGNVNYLFYPDRRFPMKTVKYFEIINPFFNSALTDGY